MRRYTHTYADAGDYAVMMTVTNGCSRQLVGYTLTVLPACDPVSEASFAWTPPLPTTGEVVTLTALASGTMPISFTWSFGDGTPLLAGLAPSVVKGGTGGVVTHSYALSGTYLVTMVAENECGEQTVTHTIAVTAPISCDPPTGVALNWTPLTPTVGEAVSFSAVATGTGPISFTWSFGDDSSGSGKVVTHTYAVTGSYMIALTATNACGVQTLTHVLVVAAPQPRVWTVYLPLVVKNY